MKSIKAAISRTEQELARKLKSILSTKGFGKSHRDVTVLDTSKDKKSSWAIPPYFTISYAGGLLFILQMEIFDLRVVFGVV